MIKRLVVKIGTSLLTRSNGEMDDAQMERFAAELSTIQSSGVEVLIVTSGAISAGTGELGWPKRPTELALKQAAAAVGQVCLMQRYRENFSKHKILVAQVLLTSEDFENKTRSHNAQATLLALLREKAVPIINENDTVVVDEIRVGDNDTLAALVAIKVKADLLVLLTDVDGLMTHPPHTKAEARLIPFVDRIDSAIEALAKGSGSDHGTGGMQTKIKAARMATEEGVTMVIANGRIPGLLPRIVDGEAIGTTFAATRQNSQTA